MDAFVDEYPPGPMNSFGWVTAPMTKTQIVGAMSGSENRNKLWRHAKRRFSTPQGIRDWDVIDAIQTHALVMGGPFNSWPLRDPLDFASRALSAPNVPPDVTALDQLIGVGDGFTTSFQLTKLYQAGVKTYTRDIYLPVVNTVLVAVGGVAVASGWSVTRLGGVVSFDAAPADGAEIRAGYLFDCEVRYESDDSVQSMVRTYRVGGFADISMVEVLPCR